MTPSFSAPAAAGKWAAAAMPAPGQQKTPPDRALPGQAGFFSGAREGIRTPNLLIRSQMLYPLSYARILEYSGSCGVSPASFKFFRGCLAVDNYSGVAGRTPIGFHYGKTLDRSI